MTCLPQQVLMPLSGSLVRFVAKAILLKVKRLMAVPSGGMAVGGGRRFRRIRWYVFFNHQSMEI